jgi:hypothetical protein
MKSKRLLCAGYVAGMMAKISLIIIPIGRCPLGRPKKNWRFILS